MRRAESRVCAGLRRRLPETTEEDRLLLRLDAAIAELSRRFHALLTEILHHPGLQQLETAWRGVDYLVRAVEDGNLVQVHLLSISREDLGQDLSDAAEIHQCGLFHHLYRQEYDQYGGIPYAAVLYNYELGRGMQECRFLDSLARIGEAAHTPIVSGISPEFLGLADWSELPGIADLHVVFELAEYRKWVSLQLEERARYLVLMLNRFLVRAPYRGAEIVLEAPRASGRRFHLLYDEARWDGAAKGYLFAHPAFGLGALLARSFVRTGWCVDIFGSGESGSLAGVAPAAYEYGLGAGWKITTQLLISDRVERQLSELGFLPLVHVRGQERPSLLSTRTFQKARHFVRDALATGSWNISSRLPFVLLVSRLAHYLKVHQRENMGGFKEAGDVEKELQQWLNGLVTADPSPSPESRSRFPLRAAHVRVLAPPDDPGRLRVEIMVQPHFQFENIDVQLFCTTHVPVATPTATEERSALHA